MLVVAALQLAALDTRSLACGEGPILVCLFVATPRRAPPPLPRLQDAICPMFIVAVPNSYASTQYVNHFRRAPVRGRSPCAPGILRRAPPPSVWGADQPSWALVGLIV